MLINPQDFVLKEVPAFHPLSQDYVNFWRPEKRKMIEGHWLGGYYMPASLYFYVNYGTIQLNTKKSRNIKSVGRPNLRDLEWLIFQNWTMARGFSGFEKDEEYTGCFEVLDTNNTDDFLLDEYPEVFNSKGIRKEFRDPLSILTDRHDYHKGRALYSNQAKNILMMGSRDTGKTYSVGVGIVLGTWLTNGLTEYSEHAIKYPKPVDMVVAGELAHYSNNMLTKTKFAYDNMPGTQFLSGRMYKSPILQGYKGSWLPGGRIEASYKMKYRGGWVDAGSKSSIRNKTFKDNSFAEQGTRPLAIILEEVGMFSNLMDVYSDTKDNLRNGLRKTGTLFMLGTGGHMEGGTQAAAAMFYSPEAYDILSFEDTWENRGRIGFFIPAYMALDEYKDERGFSNIERAVKHLQQVRETIKSSKAGSEALNKELQYRPIVPSEMFLSRKANIMPTAELQRRGTEIITNNIQDYVEKKVELFFDHNSPYNGVNYKIDNSLIAINQHPWKKDSIEGATIIYELPYQDPEGNVPPGAYIIGCDPFRDNTEGGDSFATIYVLKTNKYPTTVGHNELVASYVGRPYNGVSQINETLHKLSLFYGNATIYFENAVSNIKDYFEKVRRLDLLAKQPTTVFNKKATSITKDNFLYGYPMSNQKIKWEAIQYVRSWLLEDRGDGKKNLDLLPDLYLIQQLMSFNMDGNFDAVMGFVGCVIGLEEIHNTSLRRQQNESARSPFDVEIDKILVNNKRLFRTNEKFSEATSSIFG